MVAALATDAAPLVLSYAERRVITALRELREVAGYGELRVSIKDGKLTIMATERMLLTE